jgi:hypothetical protein
VSQEVEEISQLSKEELDQEEMAQLVKKALEEGTPESKLILTLSEWTRPGPSFEDYGHIKIIYGKADKIVVDHIYNYPTTDEYTYVIIPKSKVVVLLHESGDDYEGGLQKHQTLYVFSYQIGWKSINLG